MNRFDFGAPFLNLLGGIRIGAQALAHLLEQLRQRHGRIGRHRHVHRQQPHIVGHPTLALEIEQRDVNHLTARRDNRREVTALAHRRAEWHAQAGNVEGQDHIGAAQRVPARVGKIQRMGARKSIAAVGVHYGRAQRFGQVQHRRQSFGIATELARNDHRPLGFGEQTRRTPSALRDWVPVPQADGKIAHAAPPSAYRSLLPGHRNRGKYKPDPSVRS